MIAGGTKGELRVSIRGIEGTTALFEAGLLSSLLANPIASVGSRFTVLP